MVQPGRPQIKICALHAGHLRLKTHAQNTQHLLFFHSNCCSCARTLPVLFRFRVGVAEDSVLLRMTPRRWIIDSRRFETKK
jgi:hypothetical protein